MWFLFFILFSFLLSVISAMADDGTITDNTTSLEGADGKIESIPLMW
jgi:hypothetical protein